VAPGVNATGEQVAEPPVRSAGHERPAAHDHLYAAPIRKAGRFRWALAALVLLGLASLVAAGLLSAPGRRAVRAGAGVAWSAWRPPDNGLAGAQEIADYLAPYYRATPAEQLAVVTVVNLDDPLAPVQVVVPTSTAGTQATLPAGNTIVYNMCGEGSSNCSIGVGKPSTARLLLLRREAFELALYTFKYIGGADAVVTLLPPGYTIQGCTAPCVKASHRPAVRPLDLAVVFERAELSPWLAKPLRDTLPEELPPSVSQMPSAPEAELVSVITAHGLFSETTASAQDGSTVITLSPLAPQ
jgi:hypothetical protein